MQTGIRFLMCFALVLAQGLAHADETADRVALYAQVKAAFARDDFADLERRFAEANSKDERMPSGSPKTAHILSALESAVGVAGKQGVDEAYWVQAENRADRWRRAYPTSSLAALAGVYAHIGHAFFHRGNRMAIDVLPDKWPLFHAELKKASDLLLAPDSRLSRDEVWHVAMLEVAQYQGVDLQAFSRFVDEASTRWPNFYSIYSVASQRLQQRWGGSREAQDWLANMAVEKTKATDGMAMYARVYWYIAYGEGLHNLYEVTNADWKKLKAGFDDMVKRYPSGRNYSAYAFFACLAGDAAATKAAFVKTGDYLEPGLWENRQWLNRCRALARDGE